MTKSCLAGHVGVSLTDKHTPGPWKFNPPDDQVLDLFSPEYFFIDGPGADVHGHMTIADARLIAAAPDLLSLVQELEESAKYWSEYDVPLGIVDRLRAAIAKATGDAA